MSSCLRGRQKRAETENFLPPRSFVRELCKEGVREGVLRLLTKALEHLSDPDMEKDINQMRYDDVGQAIVSANKITETTKIIKDKLLELRKKQEKDLKILEKKNRSKWK